MRNLFHLVPYVSPLGFSAREKTVSNLSLTLSFDGQHPANIQAVKDAGFVLENNVS